MGLFGSNKPFRFRFYIAGESDRSTMILTSIKEILDEKIKDLYDVETINVFFKEKVAKTDGICVTPSLAKVHPAPIQKFYGCFKEKDELRKTLSFLDEEKRKYEESKP